MASFAWSWASCIRRTPVPEGHVPNKIGFCEDCGIHVEICWRCQKRAASMDGACIHCWNSFSCFDSEDPVQDDQPTMICCSDCRIDRYAPGLPKRPVRHEVWDYKYVPACLCCPMSPTNVIRYPALGERKYISVPVYQRKYYAKQVYQQEMAFSGDKKKALILYASFFMWAEVPPEFKKFRRFHRALARLERRKFKK